MASAATVSATLDQARALAARGWGVFPAPRGEKKSHLKAEFSGGRRWGNTVDDAQITSAWDKWPDANVGIACGPESGLFVVEADTIEGHGVDGLGELERLIAENEPLPATIEAVSPSGSRHLYFAWPEGVSIINSEGRIAPGVDVRGAGGMVIAPPSVKPGKIEPYRWVNPPGLFDLAECPAWLLKLCMTEPRERAPAAINHRTEASDDDKVLGLLYTRPNTLSREDWVRVCFALKHHFGDRAREPWLSFSSRFAGPVSAGEAERQWETANPSGNVGLGTVVHLLGGFDRELRSPASGWETDDPGWQDMPDDFAHEPELRDQAFEHGAAMATRFDPATGEIHKPDEPELLPSLDLAELSKVRAKPTTFAIERLAPDGEVTTLNGPGSAGKSLYCQQVATACAAGLGHCLGLAVTPGTAIYLSCEDDEKQLHWRQERLCEALRVPMASLAGKLHLVSLRGLLGNELAVFSNGAMSVTPAFRRMVTTIRTYAARLVFLDNVAHLFAGNENDRADVTRFINLLNKLAAETGAAIVLIGHPNKAGDEWSGSTGWNNAVRSRGWMEHDEETGLRTLILPKANYSEKGELTKFRWHEGAFVRDEDLGVDAAAQLREVIRVNAAKAAFLRCLHVRNEQERPVSDSPYTQTYAPKVFAIMPEAKGIKVRDLEAAMECLFRAEEIDRGVVCRVGRKDREGLRIVRADLRADPAPRPCADPALTPRAPAHSPTPIDKSISGAALGPAAPLNEGDDDV